MITVQNYAVSDSDATPIEQPASQWPTLADALATLADVEAFSRHYLLSAPQHYHLRRSIENLTTEVAGCLNRLDPDVLAVITYQQPAQA